MPKIINSISEMSMFCHTLTNNSDSIGFVPTMGALHQGHLSLIEESIKDNKYTIVSIFVNPTQFGSGEDFGKYPRDTETDIKLLKNHKIDAIFIPNNSDIYPENYLTGKALPLRFFPYGTGYHIYCLCKLPPRTDRHIQHIPTNPLSLRALHNMNSQNKKNRPLFHR